MPTHLVARGITVLGEGGAALPLDLMQAAELIRPQAQAWSVAIFNTNHLSALISQRSTDRWVVLEVGRILRQDKVEVAVHKLVSIEILVFVAITQAQLLRLRLQHRIQVEVGGGDVNNDEAL